MQAFVTLKIVLAVCAHAACQVSLGFNPGIGTRQTGGNGLDG